MKTEALMQAITDIRDPYIVEYGKLTENRKPMESVWKRWLSIAACLAIVICAASLLYAHFNQSHMDDPRGGEHYSFASYSELCDVLPDNHILRYIDAPESATITCEGYHSTEIQAPVGLPAGSSLEYDDYYILDVTVIYPDNTSLRVQCEVSIDMSLDDYIHSRKPFGTTDEQLLETIIKGYNIRYAQATYPDGAVSGYTAVFADGSDYFTVYSTISDQDTFLEYVTNLLND